MALVLFMELANIVMFRDLVGEANLTDLSLFIIMVGAAAVLTEFVARFDPNLALKAGRITEATRLRGIAVTDVLLAMFVGDRIGLKEAVWKAATGLVLTGLCILMGLTFLEDT